MVALNKPTRHNEETKIMTTKLETKILKACKANPEDSWSDVANEVVRNMFTYSDKSRCVFTLGFAKGVKEKDLLDFIDVVTKSYDVADSFPDFIAFKGVEAYEDWQQYRIVTEGMTIVERLAMHRAGDIQGIACYCASVFGDVLQEKEDKKNKG
jgi:hypothetical protein